MVVVVAEAAAAVVVVVVAVVMVVVVVVAEAVVVVVVVFPGAGWNNLTSTQPFRKRVKNVVTSKGIHVETGGKWVK